MKKFITTALLICLVGTSFMLTGCKDKKEESLQDKITEKAMAYRTDLEDSIESLSSNDKIEEYLTNWAKSKSIKHSVDNSGNIIYEIPASDAYKEAPPTIVVCTYDAKNIKSGINQLATALYIAKNNEETGPLSVIFTSSDGNDFSGVKALSEKHFPDNANVFCLNDGVKQRWSFNTAAMSSYKFSGNLEYTEPSGSTAYKVTISGLPGGTPDAKISSYPNPIKELGDLLAYFKTNAMIFELSNITGGNCGNLYPQSAEMTVVIDDNYTEKFQSKMESTIKKFMDKKKEDYPDVEYKVEQVDMPSQVLTKDSQNTFVSALYTLIDGVYFRNEDDDVVSITNLGSLTISGDAYTILASGYSMTKDNMAGIDLDFETICGISGITYEKTAGYAKWKAKEDSEFAKEITKAFKDYTRYDMEYKDVVECTNASFIAKKNPKCNLVDISYGQEKIERYAGTIITFMKNLPHTEEAK